MPYKYIQEVNFKDWESLKLDQTISDDDYKLIPEDYKTSWKHTDSKPTHIVKLLDGCIYAVVEITKESTRQDDIKNWFAKKI